MTRRCRAATIIASLALLSVSEASSRVSAAGLATPAPPGRDSFTPPQLRRQTGGPPPYDLKSEVTIRGTVLGTETITPPDRPEQTVLLLSVDGGKLGVFVGPTAWIVKQKLAFTKGAEIEVIGNTGFRYNGGAAVQPRRMTIGKATLDVRDAAGTPVWESGAAVQR